MKILTALVGSMLVLLGSVAWTNQQNPKPAGASLADSVKTDPETGLALHENLPIVKAHCTPCHSSKLIIQNHLTRTGWTEKIRWMQKYHKLWDLGPSEPVVLSYLEKYYGPTTQKFDGRRKPLEKVSWYPLKNQNK